MKLKLQPESAVPLYHQIAEAILYRLATGRLKPGSRLPPLRAAARDWGVNIHTVGRAYRELAQQGFVEACGRQGTRVLPAAGRLNPKRGQAAPLDAFVTRIVKQAWEKHGLSPRELAGMLQAWSTRAPAALPTVHVVECSEHQCLDHAREIEARWHVKARPWLLSNDTAPPAGPVVGTFFHYHEIRNRWPSRRDDVRFVAIHPDPQLPARIPAPTRGTSVRRLVLCEFDEPKALNTIAELELILPRHLYRIEPRVVKRGDRLLDRSSRTPVILPPRVWAALSDEERACKAAVPLRFHIDDEELEALGVGLAWSRRIPVSAA